MVNNKQLKVMLGCLTLVMTFIILGITMATLVKIYEKPRKTNQELDGGLGNKPNLVNIPPAVTISSQTDHYKSYKEYAKTLRASLNLSVDPCKDFFLYTCSSISENMSFDKAQLKNLAAVVKHARKKQSMQIGMQAAYHFQKCIEAQKNPVLIHKNGETIREIYENYRNLSGIKFPLFERSWSGRFPAPQQLAQAMGYLSGLFEVQTFLSLNVDTNWKHPSEKGVYSFKLFVDQSQLTYADTYYIKAWDLLKDDYKNVAKEFLKKVANYVGATLDESQLEKDVEAILEMEHAIATQINTKEKNRRIYERQVHQTTIQDATKNYPLIDFDIYIDRAITLASTKVKSVVGSAGYTININEPSQLQNLTTFLKTKVQPRTIYNYMFFRLLRSNKGFLPDSMQTIADRWMIENRHILGRQRMERWRRRSQPHPSEFGHKDVDIDLNCASENVEALWYISGRFFLEEFLPKKKDQEALKSSLALLVANVLDGFESQIDKLNWMTDSTKKGAYNKIKYLVRNVAYPDLVLDDEKLNKYYEKLDFSLTDDYLTILNSIRRFQYLVQFEVLTITTGGIRDDFGGPPAIVNAWYQPEVNSITFPLGILQQPFFDINYPAAVNYGAMGVVAGHELTHAFDDEGVQWDGLGKLKNWIDDVSKSKFDNMADCVDNQYSQFEPIPGFKIDGKQTLGENLADNGGIRAAYNAFEAHQNYWGSDDRLPDSELGSYTPEQLFFLSFARVWCEKIPSKETLQRQILVDPHSPSQFRVLGTLQNFPAFRSAFNCPLENTYTPKDHCNVWASEAKVVTGIPPLSDADSSEKVNNINPPEKKDTDSYKTITKRLKQAINISALPCDNFLSYACGNYDQNRPTLAQEASSKVRSAALSVLSQPQISIDPSYLILGKQYVSACKSHNRDDTTYVKVLVTSAEKLLDQEFPTFSSAIKLKALKPDKLGKALGLFWATSHTEVFVSVNVKPFHQIYQLEQPNAFYIDQPRLTFDQKWYVGAKASELKPLLIDYIKNLFTRYRQALKLSINSTLIDKDVENLADYEFYLANNFIQNEYTRVPDYNRVRFSDFLANQTAINFSNYFNYSAKAVYADPDVLSAINEQDVVLKASTYLEKLNAELTNVKSDSKLRVIYNYIFYRLLDANQLLLPGDKPESIASNFLNKDAFCGEMLNLQLPLIYSSAAIDHLYGINSNFQLIQRKVAEMTDSIQHGFSAMIDTLSWLPLSTRKQALDKVESIVRNVGVPDIVLDQSKLEKYYSDFKFTNLNKFFLMIFDLKTFARRKQLQQLTRKSGIDRTDFQFNLHPDPIWSSYDLNSITFTLNALQEPLFSLDYPSAFNFGLLGSLIGQQVGHAFDLNGVRFDKFGQLQMWFNVTVKEFENTLNCLSKQYSSYCPFISNDANTCKIDVNDTMNSNLADNIGLQAALRGFRNYINQHGQDARLPDDILSRFTNEQLLFIGYAQQFCPKTNFAQYNFGAKQSPNEYRLLGTLSNSQTFRSSFNCPTGKKYAPSNYCKVWTNDDDKPNLGVPETETVLPPMNIPAIAHRYTDGYKKCAKALEDTIDTRVNPCDDFYGYVCKRYKGQSSFTDMAIVNQVKLITRLRHPQKDEPESSTQERRWFEQCAIHYDSSEWPKMNQHSYLPYKVITNLENNVGVKFPLAQNESVKNPPPSPTLLGQTMGFLSRNIDGVPALISYFIFNDLFKPDQGYRLYLDAPVLFGDLFKYQDSKWDTSYKPQLVESIVTKLSSYFDGIGVNIDPQKIRKEAGEIANFEWALTKGIEQSSDDLVQIYNSITVKNATTLFPSSVNISAYLLALTTGLDGLEKKLTDPDYLLMIQAPNNFIKFLVNLNQAALTYSISDDTIWNYFFYRIIHAKCHYLPGKPPPLYYLLHQMPKRPSGFPEHGIKRPPMHLPKHHPIYTQANISRTELLCSLALGNKFGEINNRLFVEALFPNPANRINIRFKIAKYAEAVTVSFRSMIDQLTWLTPNTKKNAYKKLDLLVHNILYPNHTFDNQFLKNYYSDLSINNDSSFLDMQIALGKFLQGKALLLLTRDTVDRTAVDDTSNVNAFYSPSANSITICAGITQPSFYDVTWPNAFNFGAIGLVLGHEITHGFDNSGVLWDGQGAYRHWMDKNSTVAFNDMAQCVVKQYSGFCKGQYCVDGQLTEGENIADNGGIQSAFRAYRSYVGLYGEDPALPGKVASQLTNDQLFFIGFARNWCEDYYLEADKYNWKEAHSPAPFRVLGTLQNYDEFRAAFNCPAESKYAPENNCKVWISEVEPHLSVPVLPAKLPETNVPEPAIIRSNNVAYSNVTDYLLQTIDVEESPCDNFYEYTCNKLMSKTNNVQKLNLDVARTMADAIENLNATSDKFYQIIMDYYQACVAASNSTSNSMIIQYFISAFNSATDTSFPLFDSKPASKFDQNNTATVIGYLAGTQFIGTLINVKVVKNFDTNAMTSSRYVLNLDEPLLTQPVHFYEEPVRSSMHSAIRTAFFNVLSQYNDAINGKKRRSELKAAADALYNVEYTLATNMRSYTDRIDPAKAENFKTISELTTNYTFLNWGIFFEKLVENAPANVKTKFIANYTISLVAPKKITNLFDIVLNTSKVSSDALANYFNFRIVWELRSLLFKVSNDGSGDFPILDTLENLNKYTCALKTRTMNYLHSRIYVDAAVKASEMSTLQAEVAKISNHIIAELKSQVLQTNWLTNVVKQNAAAKFDALTLNTFVDPKAMNNTFLRDFYGIYKTPSQASPKTVFEAVRKFMINKELSLLDDLVRINRDEFSGSSTALRPVYDALTNSLSVPVSLVTKPYFDSKFPLASNYGGLGYLIAHELAHSFDAFGIQFDQNGNLKAILDKQTQAKFDNMTTCLIKQYDQICPLPDGAYSQNCLNGTLSLNENVADNAGVHAAYSAYLAGVNYRGGDPRLNNPLMGQFSENQLFFLAYVRNFCELPESDDTLFANILNAKNPPDVRVKMALRNYPAFKVAFNCPIRSVYAPEASEQCTVWLTENSIPNQ